MRRRVLLITPQFYGAEKEIKEVLEEFEYEVIWLENKEIFFDYHGTKSKLKLLRRLYFFFFSPAVRYMRGELKKIRNLEFDILFSINAHSISPFLLRKLKKANHRLYSILYLWDSFEMYNWKYEIPLFDRVYSFDPEDSRKYNLTYKPNFYISRFNRKSSEEKGNELEFDLFFVGKFSPMRLCILDKINILTETQPVSMFLKVYPAYKVLLHNQTIYTLFQRFRFRNKWINNYRLNYEAVEGILKRKFLISCPMSYIETQNHLANSNVILDLPYEEQTGHTHRVIEALSKGKKLLTTNINITKEEFYNPDQIHVLDIKKPELDLQWLREKKSFSICECFAGLELSEWLKSIFDVAIA